MARKQIWLATAVAVPVLAIAGGVTVNHMMTPAHAATTMPALEPPTTVEWARAV